MQTVPAAVTEVIHSGESQGVNVVKGLSVKEKLKRFEYTTTIDDKDLEQKSGKCDCDSVDSDSDSESDMAQGSNSIRRLKVPTPLEMEKFSEGNVSGNMGAVNLTMNVMCLKLAELDMLHYHDTDGVATRLATVQTQADENSTKVSQLFKENTMLKGIVQRQFKQIMDLNDKVTYLSAKSMENNVTISGLEEAGKKEQCRETVVAFLKQKVEIDVAEEEVLVTHRIGKYMKSQRKPRLMVVRCTYPLKECIMSNVKNLKDKANSKGDNYYINKQLPEKLAEQNREIRQIVRKQKSKEETLPMGERSQIQVQNKKVYIDGEEVVKLLLPPEPMELFTDNAETEKIDKIKLASSDVETEKGSVFQAFAMKASQLVDVKRGYVKVRQLNPSVTHVVAAYLGRNKEAYQDDDEHGSGFRLLKKLQEESPPPTSQCL